MAGWQPGWKVLIAFNNGVFDDPALITSIASPPGSVGAHNVWTDVTADVRDQVDTNRGRQHETDRVQTGTLSLTLDNRLGRYDPWNAAGPYAGMVIPGKPVRLQATDPNTAAVTALFTGLTDVWTTGWAAPSYSTVQLSCVDWYAYLSNIYLNIPIQYFNQISTTSGIQAFWPLFDPIASTTVNDFGPGFFTGTVTGTPVFGVPGPWLVDTSIPAVVPTACQFGSGGAFNGDINVPVTISINASSLSVEAWVQLASPPTQPSAVWSEQDASHNTLALDIDTAGRAALGVGGTVTGICTGTTNICDGDWHHVVATWAGSAGGQSCIYVDGLLQKTATTASTVTATSAAIGVNFPGQIANVAIWSMVLTAAQVNTHFAYGVGASYEPSGARIARVCGWANVPTANASIDAGKSTVQPTATDLTTTTALSYLQTVEQTEDGLLFMNGAGQVRFQSRDTIYTTRTSTVTFGDGGGAEIPFELSPTIATDTLDQWIETSVQRNGGVVQVANSGQLGKVYQVSGLLQTNDSEVMGMAEWLLGQFSATPKPRIRSITVHPLVTPTGTATTALLGLDLGAVVTVNRHTLPGSGTAFTQTCNVEGINHHVDPSTGDWTVELQLTPLPPQRPWIWGTSQWSTDTNWFF